MEFKQNKYLPAEKQVVTADPDVTSVSITLYILLFKEEKTCGISCLCFICVILKILFLWTNYYFISYIIYAEFKVLMLFDRSCSLFYLLQFEFIYLFILYMRCDRLSFAMMMNFL